MTEGDWARRAPQARPSMCGKQAKIPALPCSMQAHSPSICQLALRHWQMRLELCPSHCSSTVGYLCGRESFTAGKASLARLQSIKAHCSLCQFTLMCWAVSYGCSRADSKMIKQLLLQGQLLQDQGWMTAGHSNFLHCCMLTHTSFQARVFRRREGDWGTYHSLV